MIAGDPRAAAVALAGSPDATIAWYLKKATTKIDSRNYAGYTLEASQTRQFPRKYHVNGEQIYPWGLQNYMVDGYGFAYRATTPPDEILKACLEEAIAMYVEENDQDASLDRSLQNRGVTSVGFRGRSQSYAPGALSHRDGFRSEEAYEIIIKYRERAVHIV